MAINWNNPNLTEFDIKDYINDANEAQGYLQAAMDDGISRWLVALGEIAKSRGMKELAEDTGLSRQSLYKTLSGKTNPKIETIDKIVQSLGFKLQIIPKHNIIG
jgi:probable addiction module antidote protein